MRCEAAPTNSGAYARHMASEMTEHADTPSLNEAFQSLGTAQIADALLRLGIRPDVAPAGLGPVVIGTKAAGRALPVRHAGSVDVFLEAFASATGGEILVVDNQGRTDEACIGDLTVMEAQAAGLGGILVWGLHRDTPELRDLGLPVFTMGATPVGPQRLDDTHPDALRSAFVGDVLVTRDEYVFADDDGAVFVRESHVEAVLAIALEIRATEEAQAGSIRAGTTLRDQLRFDEYLQRRARDPEYTFRIHLREFGGAIEE